MFVCSFCPCRIFWRRKLRVHRECQYPGAAVIAKVHSKGTPNQQNALLTTATGFTHPFWHKLQNDGKSLLPTHHRRCWYGGATERNATKTVKFWTASWMLYKYKKCTYIFLQILDLVPLLSLKIVNTSLSMTVVLIVLLQFLCQEKTSKV